jgi:hypothetical protein
MSVPMEFQHYGIDDDEDLEERRCAAEEFLTALREHAERVGGLDMTVEALRNVLEVFPDKGELDGGLTPEDPDR